MIKKIKPKSEFNRNVLTLMTGTTIAQAIPIAISPILTRIYTPEDFGIFAIFFALTAIFGSIANARYELAIMLPKKDEDAINIFALGFIITFLMSFSLFFVVLFFNDYIVSLFKDDDISLWLYFIPISVFFVGFFNILNYYNNRIKKYKDIAKSTVLKSIVLAVTQLSIGFFKDGASGLISGEILSRMFSNIRLLKNIYKNKSFLSIIKLKKILVLAKKYKEFPKFSIISSLANTMSSHLTSLLISIYYSIVTLGYFSLSERVLGAPISLIGKSIGQVFFQEASIEYKNSKNIKETFFKTLKKLIIIGIPIFSLLFFIVEDIFEIVFGKEWRIAGEYASILIFLFAARFIVSPLTLVPIIFKRNKIDFYFQLIMLFLVLSIILLAQLLHLSFYDFIIGFSIAYGLYYYCYLIFLINFISRK